MQDSPQIKGEIRTKSYEGGGPRLASDGLLKINQVTCVRVTQLLHYHNALFPTFRSGY